MEKAETKAAEGKAKLAAGGVNAACSRRNDGKEAGLRAGGWGRSADRYGAGLSMVDGHFMTAVIDGGADATVNPDR